MSSKLFSRKQIENIIVIGMLEVVTGDGKRHGISKTAIGGKQTRTYLHKKKKIGCYVSPFKEPKTMDSQFGCLKRWQMGEQDQTRVSLII
jgi:hypothetical protein